MNVMKLMAVGLAGWINQQQEDVIDYLHEEVRILKELRGEKRLLFNDEQRSRLARKAKRIRFSRLKEIVGVVTPQTLLAWHQQADREEVRFERRSTESGASANNG